MKITIRNDSEDKEGRFLVFEGAMTHPSAHRTERWIFNSIHNYKHIKIDLSGVREIDVSGKHLLGVLLSYSKESIEIVGMSPVVEAAMAPLLMLRDAAMRVRPIHRIYAPGDPRVDTF